MTLDIGTIRLIANGLERPSPPAQAAIVKELIDRGVEINRFLVIAMATEIERLRQ